MIIDRHFKLALWAQPKFYGLLLIGCVGFFTMWDVAGISFDVFRTNQANVSGWHVFTPNLPIEEFLFLTLLGYVTINSWRLYECLHTR